MLSPLGPALEQTELIRCIKAENVAPRLGRGAHLQFGGGSSVISASSFWMRLADVVSALDALGVDLASFLARSPPPEDEELVVAMTAMRGTILRSFSRDKWTMRLERSRAAPIRSGGRLLSPLLLSRLSPVSLLSSPRRLWSRLLESQLACLTGRGSTGGSSNTPSFFPPSAPGKPKSLKIRSIPPKEASQRKKEAQEGERNEQASERARE